VLNSDGDEHTARPRGAAGGGGGRPGRDPGRRGPAAAPGPHDVRRARPDGCPAPPPMQVGTPTPLLGNTLQMSSYGQPVTVVGDHAVRARGCGGATSSPTTGMDRRTARPSVSRPRPRRLCRGLAAGRLSLVDAVDGLTRTQQFPDRRLNHRPDVTRSWPDSPPAVVESLLTADLPQEWDCSTTGQRPRPPAAQNGAGPSPGSGAAVEEGVSDLAGPAGAEPALENPVSRSNRSTRASARRASIGRPSALPQPRACWSGTANTSTAPSRSYHRRRTPSTTSGARTPRGMAWP